MSSSRADSGRFIRRGNRALSGSNWAAVRHCFNRRDHEWLSLGSGGKFFSNHFRSFSATSAHFRPLPPIFPIWCPDGLAVSGDLKIGTAFNTAFRLEIRHEAWQEPSVTKTRLPCFIRLSCPFLLPSNTMMNSCTSCRWPTVQLAGLIYRRPTQTPALPLSCLRSAGRCL